VNAIVGNVKEVHFIDKEKCIKCGAYVEACKRDGILKVPRSHAA
jgi:ferredoxin